MADGQIRIRVVPDVSKFRADLKRALKDAEKWAKIKVSADTSSFERSMEKLRAKFANESFKVKALLDENGIERKLRDLTEDRDVHLEANLDSAVTRARLAALTRPRTVSIITKVNEAAMAKTIAALGALSGARVASDAIKNLGRNLADLDRNLPKIALVATGIAGIAFSALSAVQGTVALGSSLAAIVPAALTLPGILGGMAVSGLAFGLAMKDVKTELAELGPVLTKIQDKVSAKFWDEARKPILDMAKNVLPAFGRGLEQVGAATGRLSATWADAVKKFLTADVLADMFQNTSGAIDIARKAMEPLVRSVTNLGTVGSVYLPRMAAWFVDITSSFDQFIAKNKANGNLFRWIDTGIDQMKQLGSVIASASGILGGLARAANAAGSGNALGSLAEGLGRISDIVNRQPFQGQLTQIFRGAGKAVAGLGRGVESIIKGFGRMAPSLERVGQTVGNVFEEIGGIIGDFISSPAVGKGLEGLFDGLLVGVKALRPAMKPLGDLFGTVAEFAGKLAAQLGPVLATAISVLAPVVEDLLKALEPLIPVLGEALISAIEQLSPVFEELVPVVESVVDLVPPLVDAFVDLLPVVIPLIPPLLQMATTILDLLVPALEFVVPLVVGFLEAVGKILQPVLEVTGAMAEFASAFLEGASGVELLQTQVGQAMLLIYDSVVNAMNGVKGFFTSVWTSISSYLTTVWAGISASAVSIWGGIRNFFTTVWNGIRSFLTNVWNGIKATAVSVWNSIKAFFSTLWSGITSVFSSATARVKSVVSKAWSVIKSTTSSVWNSIKFVISKVWSTIRSVVSSAASRVRSVVSKAWSSIKSLTSSAWNSIKSVISRVWSSIRSVISNAISSVRSRVSSGFRSVRSAISSAMNGAKSVISRAWSSMVSTFRSGVSRAIGVARTIGSRIRAVFSGAGSWLVSAGRSIVSGLVNGIRGAVSQAAAAAASMARQAINAAKGAFKINSPSKVFRDEIGVWIPAGVAAGIDKNQKVLDRATNRMVNVPDISAVGGGKRGSLVGAGAGVTQNIYTQDPHMAAAEAQRYLRLGGA